MHPGRSLFLVLAMCLSLAKSRTDDGYEVFPSVPGSRYKLYTVKRPWTEALSLCQEDGDGSHLIVVNSEDEANVVRDLFYRITDATMHIHIGIDDLVEDDTWVTVEGVYTCLI
jgi:hypothetical protein